MTENTMATRKRSTVQRTIYKTVHIQLKIELHEPHLKSGVNSGTQGG
jgi:hypothetical protein